VVRRVGEPENTRSEKPTEEGRQSNAAKVIHRTCTQKWSFGDK
jgi:hypothetical protein